LIPALEQLADQQRGAPRLAALLEVANLHNSAATCRTPSAVLVRAESQDGASPELCERSTFCSSARSGTMIWSSGSHGAPRRVSGGPLAAALELRRAAILKDDLRRPEDAAAVYRSVLEYAPDSGEARAGLERALRSGADATGLARFLEDQERRSGDPARSHLALERALLLEERLDRRRRGARDLQPARRRERR
jgi:hypothetical protein